MNRAEQKAIMEFPEGLDKKLLEKFGKRIKAKTTWNFFTGKHTTVFDASKARKGVTLQEINLYIEGFTDGNVELRERLHNLKNQQHA